MIIERPQQVIADRCYHVKGRVKAIESSTMLGTVYKFCLICVVETLKLIGETLQQVMADERSKYHHQRQLQQSSRSLESSPPMPRRTKSKVIKINKAWLKKSLSGKKSPPAGVSFEEDTTSSVTSTAKPTMTRSKSWTMARFGRSLNLSRRCLSRRHSYPPFRSRLERVVEEEDDLGFE